MSLKSIWAALNPQLTNVRSGQCHKWFYRCEKQLRWYLLFLQEFIHFNNYFSFVFLICKWISWLSKCHIHSCSYKSFVANTSWVWQQLEIYRYRFSFNCHRSHDREGIIKLDLAKSNEMLVFMIFSALVGAIVWDLITWYFGAFLHQESRTCRRACWRRVLLQ